MAADLPSIKATDTLTRLTWIGHASFLASIGGRRFLIDPVFSDRLARLLPRRCPPGVLPQQVPAIDAALISHSHYDHLDKPSVLALPRDVALVAPLGVGALLRAWGRLRVFELDWWQSLELDRVRITLVPSRHWSRRWFTDTNQTLWGGFVIESDGVRVYHAGDSAWFDGFAEIGRRFPDIDAAMLPIGAYDPAWFMEHHHLNPEQAGDAFLALRARQLVPMHWGTFRLTDEPLVEPAERLRRWWDERSFEGRRLRCMAVGETITVDGG